MISPSIAFLAWVPISLFFFRRYPLRVAILVNFIAGAALLAFRRLRPYRSCIPLLDFGNMSTVDPLLH